MTQPNTMPRSSGSSGDPAPMRCTYHPDTETYLRCSRCAKPICPKCAVRTPVGLRCPDCAGGAMPRGTAGVSTVVRAFGAGLLVAAPVGILWGIAPIWGFYLALLMGFASAEAVARGAGGRTGVDLQVVAIGVVVIGLFISRVWIARAAGWDLFALDWGNARVQRALWVRPIPDLLFAALPLVIAWFRFR